MENEEKSAFAKLSFRLCVTIACLCQCHWCHSSLRLIILTRITRHCHKDYRMCDAILKLVHWRSERGREGKLTLQTECEMTPGNDLLISRKRWGWTRDLNRSFNTCFSHSEKYRKRQLKLISNLTQIQLKSYLGSYLISIKTSRFWSPDRSGDKNETLSKYVAQIYKKYIL